MTQQTPAPAGSRWITCARCDLVFHTDWPEGAAQAEYQATFPQARGPKSAVCPDCYLQVLQHLNITPSH